MKGISVGRGGRTRVKLSSGVSSWEIGYYDLDNLEVSNGVGIGRCLIIEAESEEQARMKFTEKYPYFLFVSIEKVDK